MGQILHDTMSGLDDMPFYGTGGMAFVHLCMMVAISGNTSNFKLSRWLSALLCFVNLS